MAIDGAQTDEVYAGYDSLLEEAPAWAVGAFPLPGGGVWRTREPDAVSVVQNGALGMGVGTLRRGNDEIQILDNAKHILFSTNTFAAPADGGLSFSFELGADGVGCAPGDLYDGFASLLCLDLSSGTAIDVFCRDDLCAAVFARLPFPGVDVPDAEPLKYWAIFTERRLSRPGPHSYEITIEPAAHRLRWTVDGDLLREARLPEYPLGEFMLGLGLMTEKTIEAGRSISCHGQGLRGHWSPIAVRRWQGTGAPVAAPPQHTAEEEVAAALAPAPPAAAAAPARRKVTAPRKAAPARKTTPRRAPRRRG